MCVCVCMCVCVHCAVYMYCSLHVKCGSVCVHVGLCLQISHDEGYALPSELSFVFSLRVLDGPIQTTSH